MLKNFFDDQYLSDHEREFLEAIFGLYEGQVKVDELKNKTAFRSAIASLPGKILKKLVGDGYFSKVPWAKIRGCVLTLIIATIGFTFVQLSLFLFSASLGKAVLLSLALIFVYLLIAPPPLTGKGVEAKWHALGFKEYLRVAEKFRLGACTPETFEQYLSYAMVFGVEEKWAARFADIYKNPPDWYESSRPFTGFNSVVFASSIASMTTSVNSAIAYSSPSGSSGFGGGGGGGSAGGGGGGGGSSAG